MKTRALSNTVLTVGAVATALMIWSGVNGYAVVAEGEAFRTHVLLALLAGFLLALAHGWVVIFLLASRWAIDSTFAELPPPLREQARAVRMRVVPFALLALVLAVANFALGGRTFTGDVSAGTHQIVSWLTVAVQVAALVVESGGLRRYSEILSTLEKQASR